LFVAGCEWCWRANNITGKLMPLCCFRFPPSSPLPRYDEKQLYRTAAYEARAFGRLANDYKRLIFSLIFLLLYYLHPLPCHRNSF
jgi:hypothetical protein